MQRKAKSRGLTVPLGFQAAGITAGIKPSGKPDMALIVADQPAVAAGVFTRNKVPGAPVIVSKRHIRSGMARAIVVNSGIANVATGQPGIDNAVAMTKRTAAAISCGFREVLPCSTGVIGVPLPMDKILPGIDQASVELARGARADDAAAHAIMTTDTVPKAAHRKLSLGGKTVHVGGTAKGSGMIAPNMATMFSFITTDVAITRNMLRSALQRAVNAPASFNRLSIDHDTSTSDCVIVLASGVAGNRQIKQEDNMYLEFVAVLTQVMQDLSYQLICDGEGTTRVFRVNVRGARSQRDADRVARTVVGSPLVKAAVHGSDPNWGRLAMAVGRSEAAVKPDKLSIAIGSIPVMQAGVNVDAPLKKLEKHMQRDEVLFEIDLGLGGAETEWLGSDLSREYVTINADYTT